MLSEKKTQKYTMPVMDLHGFKSSHRRPHLWRRLTPRYLRKLYHSYQQISEVFLSSSSEKENHRANRLIWAASLIVLFIAIIRAYFA